MLNKYKILFLFVVIFLSGNSVSMTLVDKYENAKVGDWVRLELTNGTVQLVFIAEKKDDSVVLEVKEMDRGFVVAWRQLVIDSAQKKTILVRQKDLLTGEIDEHQPKDEENIDEVLQAEFRETGEEKITQRIEEWDNKTLKYVKKNRTFQCKLYRSVISDRFIEIWYSDEIPLYPIKANIPGLNTTIRLVRYGTGMESKFEPVEKIEKKDN